MTEKIAIMTPKKTKRVTKTEKRQPRSLQERPGVPRELPEGSQHKPVIAGNGKRVEIQGANAKSSVWLPEVAKHHSWKVVLGEGSEKVGGK